MSDCLSREVIQEILFKLSAKDLVRCTAVCKAWNSMIKDPIFISTHINKQKKQSNGDGDGLLLIKLCDHQREDYSLHHHSNTLALYKHLNFPFGYGFEVFDCCNGLVFLAGYSNDNRFTLLLWNPTIRKAVVVPTPSICLDHGDRRSYPNLIGLGFDSKHNDYKVVLAFTVVEREGECKMEDNGPIPTLTVTGFSAYVVGPQLFSLNANSWETITPSPPQYDIEPYSCHAFVNGAIHWIGWRESDTRTVIVRFNVSDEVFDEFELPRSLVESFSPSLAVKNYGESSIAVVDTSKDGQLDVWIMTRYGMVDSWTKVFSREIGRSEVLWFKNEDEVLLQWHRIPLSALANIVSLNMKEARMKMLRHPKEKKYRSSHNYLARGYVETLVLLDKGKPAAPSLLELASLDNDDETNDDSSKG